MLSLSTLSTTNAKLGSSTTDPLNYTLQLTCSAPSDAFLLTRLV